jgi:hypothetical protein
MTDVREGDYRSLDVVRGQSMSRDHSAQQSPAGEQCKGNECRAHQVQDYVVEATPPAHDVIR